MFRIAKRVAALESSATIAVSERAARLKAEGRDIVAFSAGEPDRDTPEHIRQAAVDAMRAGHTRYTATAGILALRAAIAQKLRRDNGLSFAPEEVLVSTGGKHALFNVLASIVDDGSEVLIPSPYWTSYPEMVKAAGGVPVIVSGDRARDYRIDAATLEKAVTPRTAAIVINSPSNPTGAVYPEAELREIALLARRREVVLVSDEIYEKLVYDGAAHVSPARWAPERTVVINGVSKTYCMTGWRIGYAAGPREIVEAATRLQSQMTSNACSVAQHAALAALTGGEEFLVELREEYRRRRDLMVDGLSKIPGLGVPRPPGAFYLFVNVSAHYRGAIKSSLDFCEALLDDVGVAVVPGSAFGEDRCVRFTFCVSPDRIRDGVGRLAAFVGKLDERRG
ncbi:MAG: hypothetical protein A3F84_20780 [Candidatus Handelsmanbacteria bacterium RIFCSPLOWO2_12_FULL_64_10]|uniref:Aminotransferase class I/classII large domain-containing protein n=1 Tax=Handelsmanbacteria sp. (strain RIFCSPLOWO2_12_FULL_64_10) TaxID=1817868 RepID=A0A1F6CV74_HANXR|nr:MAG: hypothetical protein A3F84_20780 [Candidatus Handelsmanbacteria bacterium RIFCSPLOWO2_12_FULL_64_10]